MQATTLENLLKSELTPSEVQVLSDDGHHFEAIIISELFEGRSKLERHRMINAIIRTKIEQGDLHALSFKTLTPPEWRILQSDN